MLKFFKKAFGSSNDRYVKSLGPLVDRINQLEQKTAKYSDAQLQGKSGEFREKIEKGASLDDLLPSAFAVVREASKRVLGMRHYDVQMVGGITLHNGKIAEMKTGEGKTLVATLPVYLNAVSGKGTHVVTVNGYLAERDAEWMGQLYGWLGLSTGVIVHGLNDQQRQQSYRSDITYGTNNEFGFDYLRDNMKFSLDRRVQRELNYAIVDEVDSILIDEARTPLIISGPAEKSSDWYYRINAVVPFLKREEDFLVEEKSHSCTLTDSGVDKVEDRLKIDNLYDVENIEILHHVTQALKAHMLFKKDAAYVVEGGKVVIVDEFTGRKMPGRRWSDGLHQAIEAKEGVRIEQENETLATITFQNYFRLYNKLSGMTGTADTEASEFDDIYKLDVQVIPTNKPIVRRDENDLVFKTEQEKWLAVADEIAEANKHGQPVLVGTTSVEKSEYLGTILTRQQVPHSVLNAKFHAMESEIVAQAGRLGSVTIATNMAGRGTDIVLGGNVEALARSESGQEEGPEFETARKRWAEHCAGERQEVLDAGGLFIIGTERHESRRVDNQLRGRAGRQGDKGRSRFFISLDDDLMRVFGSDRIKKVMETLRMPEGEAIEHKWINKAVENAQTKIESRNYDIRKHLLDYDDVMNMQRKALYGLRDEILTGDLVHQKIGEAIDDVVDKVCDDHFPEGMHAEDYDIDAWVKAFKTQFNVDLDVEGVDFTSYGEYRDLADKQVRAFYEAREEKIVDALQRASEAQGSLITAEVARERWRFFERESYLRGIDKLWKHHLKVMDSLRQGINLEAYAQKDPKLVYKKQGYELFELMVEKIKENVTEVLFRASGPSEAEIAAMRDRRLQEEQKHNMAQRAAAAESKRKAAEKEARYGKVVHQGGTFQRDSAKIGRNDPCPCGSGQKFKKCHMGKEEELALLLQQGKRTA